MPQGIVVLPEPDGVKYVDVALNCNNQSILLFIAKVAQLVSVVPLANVVTPLIVAETEAPGDKVSFCTVDMVIVPEELPVKDCPNTFMVVSESNIIIDANFLTVVSL